MADLVAKPDGAMRIIIEDGKARAIAADGSAEFFALLTYPRELFRNELHELCGKLLNDRYIDEPISEEEVAVVIDRENIPVNAIPTQPIIKMMKAEHADRLTNEGVLRLGSIDYFRKYDQAEIGDSSEGLCVIGAYDGRQTQLRKIVGGLNDKLFCTYAGDVSPDVIKAFGYDAAVEIIDPVGFSGAISKHIKATSENYSRCLYVRDLAIYGKVNEPLDAQDIMNGPFGEMLGICRAFLKSRKFSHQSEFRFTWQTPSDSKLYTDIECLELASFVKRVH